MCSMAGARIPGSLGKNSYLADALVPLCDSDGCRHANLPGPIGARYHRPVRVADAEKDKTKKHSTSAKIDTIIFHMYIDITDNFSSQDFIDWLQGTGGKLRDDNQVYDWQEDRWTAEGIKLETYTSTKSGVADFKKSLQRESAVVVYLGHSTLDEHHGNNSLGLTPQLKSVPEIPNDQLRTLLAQSTASMVIIASCDSMTAVGKPTAGPVIIATDSGPDKMTFSTHWARALGALFFLLIGLQLDSAEQPSIQRKAGHATINEALEASDAEFAKLKDGDRFKLVHGDGSKKLFP